MKLSNKQRMKVRLQRRKKDFFAALRQLGFKTYNEYLYSEHWKDLRKRYWKSRLPKDCYVCGVKEGLHLHHKSYKKLGREPLYHLILLCARHHKGLHELQNKTSMGLWGITKQYKRKSY